MCLDIPMKLVNIISWEMVEWRRLFSTGIIVLCMQVQHCDENYLYLDFNLDRSLHAIR